MSKKMCSNRALVFNRRTELYLGGRITIAKSTLVSAGVLSLTALIGKNLKYSLLGKKWMFSHAIFEKNQYLRKHLGVKKSRGLRGVFQLKIRSHHA